jgi:outer membrane receptor for ferrienterochelin and colicin
MSLGAGAGHTKKWKNDALSINASYINLAPYNELVPDDNKWNKLPENIAGEAVYRHKTQNGLFKLYTAFDRTRFDVEQEDINFEELVRFDLTNSNWYSNASYNGFIGDRTTLTTGISYSASNANVDLSTVNVISKEKSFHLKAKLKHSFNNVFKLSYGVETISTEFDETGVENQTNPFSYKFTNSMSAAFAESDIFFSTKFAGKFGLRADYNALFSAYTFSPRISLAHKFNKQAQVSLAYGNFYQAPQNDELKIAQDLDLQMASHFILNFQYEKNNQLFRAEAFYKEYDHLVQYESEFNRPISNLNNNGFGYASGIDLFWRDTRNIKNLQYWLSYSYLDTKRKFQDYSAEVMPSYATKHNASLVTKYWISSLRSQVGMTYNFASGRPYNDLNSTSFMDGRTKSYNNVSFNWSYLISQQKILFISASNLLGFKNTFGYDYANTPDANGIYNRRAIVPSSDRFFFVGFFWTISDDKTKNQLDNL